MAEQLRFTGDPIFEPTPFEGILKHYFVDEIREFMKRDTNLLAFGPRFEGPSLPPPLGPLFEPAPTCDRYSDLGEQTLDCNLDAGHSGPHYDAHLRLEWSSR